MLSIFILLEIATAQRQAEGPYPCMLAQPSTLPFDRPFPSAEAERKVILTSQYVSFRISTGGLSNG